MKRIITCLGILILVTSCSSSKKTVKDATDVNVVQVKPAPANTKLDRTKPPVPGPAPVIQLADYNFFQLENGMKVFVVQNDKLPRVTYSLQIDRDPLYEGDKAGYISVMGELLGRGTKTKTKAEIDEAIDFIGASFTTYSRGIYGSSLTKHSKEVLAMMRDVLLNPSFPEEELEKIRKLNLSDLAASRDDPGAIIANIRGLVVYGADHPYGEILRETSLNNISRKDIVNYYNTYWSPKNAYLAVIGDITVQEARKNVESIFGEWQGDEIPEHDYKQPTLPEQTTVVLVDRPQSVQSEIRVTYPVNYKTGDDDFFAARIMNQILGGGITSRLMQNLREEKGYTYGVGSSLQTDELIGRFSAGASVRNEVTDSAIHQILFEMKNLADNGITEDELKSIKAYLTGSFARSLERPQTIAGFAINTAVKDLPETFYRDYLKNLNAVTVEDINAAAKKFIKAENAYIVVVGNAEEIEGKLKVFGRIIQYDVDGNIVERNKLKSDLEGIKPEAILAKYVEAIGGAENIKRVKNQSQTWEINLFGQTMNVKSVKTADGKFKIDVMMGEVAQQSIICDGDEVVTVAGGRHIQMDEKTNESEKINNRLFPELYYGESAVEMRLSGLEKVNGKDAYKLSIIYPSGKESEAYFDVESGLKVKESKTIDTPRGSFPQISVYSNFKEVEGVLFPYTSTMQMGDESVGSKMIKLENNTAVGDDVFFIEHVEHEH